MRAVLVLPAAGVGTRFGGEVAKQLLPLAGIPVLRRSLDAFAGLVTEAVVPVSARNLCSGSVTSVPPTESRAVAMLSRGVAGSGASWWYVTVLRYSGGSWGAGSKENAFGPAGTGREGNLSKSLKSASRQATILEA